MAASNCGGFSWTEEKSSIILDILTHLVISKKLDPLADDTIEMVLSKVVEFKDFTLFRGITTQDVKGHLIERRKIYMRVCELAPTFCSPSCFLFHNVLCLLRLHGVEPLHKITKRRRRLCPTQVRIITQC